MIHSTYVGVTTMKSFQQALSNTANNISNSQTYGHKSDQAIFTDLFTNRLRGAGQGDLTKAAINPMNMGNGVKIGGISTDFSQGSLTFTGGKTDVALEGEGFFMIGNNEGEDILYTRKGTFNLSKEQMLVNESGSYVYGWNVDPITGLIDTEAQAEPIFIPLNSAIAGTQSTNVSLQGNIDSRIEVGEYTKIQIPSYDSAGNQIDVDMNFVKTQEGVFKYVAIPSGTFQPNEHVKNAFFNIEEIAGDLSKGDYEITTQVSADGSTVDFEVIGPSGSILTNTLPNATGSVELTDATGKTWLTVDYNRDNVTNTSTTLTIGDVGQLEYGATGRTESVYSMPDPAVTDTTITPQLTYTSPFNGTPVTMDIDFDLVTLFSTDKSISVYEVDGNRASSLQDFSINDGGVIEAYYTDGTIRRIGQIGVSTFANNNGLEKIGNGNFKETISSGLPVMKVSGENGAAMIRSQSLENSNVDLSEEFVDLMAYQKAFQAGTKVIQVSDELVSGTINLIR